MKYKRPFKSRSALALVNCSSTTAASWNHFLAVFHQKFTRELLRIWSKGEGSDTNCACLSGEKKARLHFWDRFVSPWSNKCPLIASVWRLNSAESKVAPPHCCQSILSCVSFQLAVWLIATKCRWASKTGNIEMIDDGAARAAACWTNKAPRVIVGRFWAESWNKWSMLARTVVVLRLATWKELR